MSCRKPNVDDCMANDTQSYTKTFSNENSIDSNYWSDWYLNFIIIYQQKKYTREKNIKQLM